MAAAAAQERFGVLCNLTSTDAQCLPLSDFIAWITKRSCPVEDLGAVSSEEEITMMDEEQLENVTSEINIGEYGDVHFQDLAMALYRVSKGYTQKLSKSARKLQQMFKRAIEAHKLCFRALRYAVQSNDAFPKFTDDELRRVIGEFKKVNFFVGQNVTTQGEVGDDYCVLSRGKCQVLLDEELVATIGTACPVVYFR